MNKSKYFGCHNFFIFYFLFFISHIQSKDYSSSLEIVAQFINITFIKGSDTVNCENCLPAGIKLSKNGTIFCSFPRWFDDVYATFGKYNKDKNAFEPWPSIEMNRIYNESEYPNHNSSGLNSILGFEIVDDYLYILDQGKIMNNSALSNSTKLMKFSLDGKLLKEYIFDSNIADPDNSFLNDVVIDKDRKLAYISDSGIANDKNILHYKPGIIVVDLNNNKSYRILDNHYSVFPDESFWLHIDKKPVKENPMLTGVDGIALSCDGDVLFFCPLTGRMIYSILTKDIKKLIYNNKSIDDIKIYEGFKKEASDGLLASSKGNLYMTGIETGSIYIANEIEEDLLRFDFKDFERFEGNKTTMWPDTLAIHEGYLYFVTNQLNNFPEGINHTYPKNGKYNFAILKFDVGNDDSYIKGCTGFRSDWGIGSIIIWICFAVIILIVLSFVLMGSNNQEEVIDKHMNLGIKED